MLAPPSARRPYVLALVVSFLVVVLLLLHHNSDYIPFPSARRPAILDSQDLPHLDKLCSLPDPFEVEYGRTNIRLTRAYEGKLARPPSLG